MPSTSKKKFSKIKLLDSELMSYTHVLGRQVPKVFHHQWSNGVINDGWEFQWNFVIYCIVSFIQCEPITR